MATEVIARRAINRYEPPFADRFRVLWKERERLNFANFVDRLTNLYGERTSFLLDQPIEYPGFSGDTLSYNDVQRLVNRFAGAMRALGVMRGDRVGLITMNRIEMAFVNFGLARIGAIPVPMNFMLRPNEIEFVVQKAGIELLVVDETVWDATIKETSAVPGVKRWAIVGQREAPEGVATVRDLMIDVPDHVAPVEPGSDDEVAMLFFTSGTTGFPKGSMMTHGAAMIGMRNMVRMSSLSPKIPRRLGLLVMPVAHAAGYATLMLNLGMGTPSYFMSKFDTNAIFDAVEQLHPTLMAGTPAMYRMLLHAGARERDWSSIKVFGGGADAFDDELVRSVRELGARKGLLGRRKLPWFVRGYGMAEANSYVTQTPWWETGDNCMGWVLKPVKYRIVDEDGRDAPSGLVGELLLKGPNLTKGYWNDPDATAAAIDEEGWFHTGDLVRKGKWRMLYFAGRSNDVIKSGGYKISANEIDQHLTQHPDVEHAATVGIPHPMKGERPFAAVQLRAGATATSDEILAWARERIAPYKCPRGIVVMQDMPFTFSMKPKRREVRERLLRYLPESVKKGE
ncbi:MAG TPA: class I adenylate-forming enzyme family protein [Actinomycetota bacterium]|nr:class I adenylate-forming enzyme family protein [Actinomycetota bacterium]